ncbi:TPA: hypothetical protein DCZ39_05600 [Patescibacteria group bacterium]|nr:hypothetical protein [Candidatus Gracilibacteria bacterium]
MNSEYFRIKRHHKDTEGRIDRPTVANKYIGKVFLTQIKFEYVKRGLEYEDMKIRLRPFFLERIAL